jgi:hypothetical protein
MRNKLILLLLAILWIVVCAAAQDAQLAPRAAQVRLVLTSVHATEKSGAKIAIEIKGKFMSDGLDGACTGEQPYSVDVYDASGRRAAHTDHGREVDTRPVVPITSCISVNVKAGTTWKDQMVVSDLYDMGKPGKYLVRVNRGDEKSNTITLTVVP